MGYCGDVMFTSQVLAQVVSVIDANALASGPLDGVELINAAAECIQAAFASYPEGERRGLEVLMGARQLEGVRSKFLLHHVVWNGRWTTKAQDFPAASAPVIIRGSGYSRVTESLRTWRQTNVGGTSRAVFSAFCDSLREDPHYETGGPPQLVGIIRKPRSAGFAAGVVYCGEPYFQGLNAQTFKGRNQTLWFNELFERVDPQSLARIPGSAVHERPPPG
jgi:hypothetical protein